jgi:hypothetical protein
MTFLQIFDGRMVLIRALKHVLQNIATPSGPEIAR